MSKVKWKGSALVSPVPAVLVTCTDGDKINVFTVAWTGILCTHPPMTYISVRPSRYSYDIIKSTGEFTINLTTASMTRTVDFCGVRSGRDTDKLKLTGIELEPASEVAAPLIAESPLSLECRVREIIPLGTHDMFIAEIIATDADSRFIDANGRLTLDEAGLLAYSHGTYFELGKKLGTFGYSVKKKKKPHKKTVTDAQKASKRSRREDKHE